KHPTGDDRDVLHAARGAGEFHANADVGGVDAVERRRRKERGGDDQDDAEKDAPRCAPGGPGIELDGFECHGDSFSAFWTYRLLGGTMARTSATTAKMRGAARIATAPQNRASLGALSQGFSTSRRAKCTATASTAGHVDQ